MQKFDVSELDRLSEILHLKADTCEALAAEHDKQGEKTDAAKQRKRAENGRYYADICREAARRLRIKATRHSFVPPTWDELRSYAKSNFPNWPEADVRSWWLHFESNGWKVSGKTLMTDWKKAAEGGWHRWRKDHPEAQSQSTLFEKNRDPEGWKEWLTRNGHRQMRHRIAPSTLQIQFEREMQR